MIFPHLQSHIIQEKDSEIRLTGMPCIKDGVITLKAIGEYPVVMWHENDLDENELTLKLEPKSSLVTNPFNMLTALELLGAENYEIDSVTADAIKADAPLLREAG